MLTTSLHAGSGLVKQHSGLELLGVGLSDDSLREKDMNSTEDCTKVKSEDGETTTAGATPSICHGRRTTRGVLNCSENQWSISSSSREASIVVDDIVHSELELAI